jgi:hypothetical protein
MTFYRSFRDNINSSTSCLFYPIVFYFIRFSFEIFNGETLIFLDLTDFIEGLLLELFSKSYSNY